MKRLIWVLALLPTLSFADISTVSSSQTIQASKINEIITLVNELKAENLVLKQAVVPVGTVYHSILTLAQYRAQNGDCWRALDGLALASSDELKSLYGYNTIPNGDSRFLRNSGPSSAELAETQEDSFQGHWHSISANTSAGAGTNNTTRGTNNTEAPSNSGIRGAISDGVNGTPRTSSETRPKNLTVNMFIKFKKTCNLI